MPRPRPDPFATDLLRASLGPALAAPYEHAFGPVPWLTAGTLAWPAGAADDVLGLWSAWAAGLPAGRAHRDPGRRGRGGGRRRGARRPRRRPALLADLRTAGPHADTVAAARPARAPHALRAGVRRGRAARLPAAPASCSTRPPASASASAAPPPARP